MSINPRDAVRREGVFEREPARRIFASELRECRYQFKEGDDEKSPTFVLLPTGERCNRLFIVGTLTEKQRQGDQNIFYRGRVVDPTGTFFIMAGSYQPEAMQQLAKVDTPACIEAMVTGQSVDCVKAKEQYPAIDRAVFRKMAYDALAQIKI